MNKSAPERQNGEVLLHAVPCGQKNSTRLPLQRNIGDKVFTCQLAAVGSDAPL